MLCALIAQSADSVVDATEVVVKRIVQRGEYVCDAVGLLIDLADKSLLVNGGTDICLCSTRSATTGTIATKTAEAITTPAEQEEDNNPNLLSQRLFILYFYHFLFVIVQHIFSTTFSNFYLALYLLLHTKKLQTFQQVVFACTLYENG